MERRTFLGTLAGAGAVGLAGCGGAGTVVTQITRDIAVEPGRGWLTEIPDISDPGGGMAYIARSDSRFSVYFFTAEADVMASRSYIKGETPDRTPQGNASFSKRATHNEECDLYEAMTPGEGARASIDAGGPYWFVLDHSHYGLPSRMPESADPLSVFLDLQVVRKHSPF